MDFSSVKNKFVDFYQKRKLLVILGGGVLVLTLAVGILLPSLLGGDDGVQVQYVSVSRGDITETIDVVGALEAQPYIELEWESGGIVSPFDLNVGDMAAKGDQLMALEDSSLSASILQAQSDILEAQTTLDNLLTANSDLYEAAQVLADAEYALRDYKADRNYWNNKGASEESIEEHRDAYYAAKQVVWEKEAAYKALSDLAVDDPEREAAYDEMKEAIQERDDALRYLNNLLGVYYDHAVETDFIEYDIALAEVEEARLAYNRYLDQSEEIAAAQANVQALQNTIDMAKIIAPFEGTVTEISAVAGEKVSSGAAAVRLDNMKNLVIEVYVSEVDINKVQVGMPALIVFDAISGLKYEGVVQSTSSAGTDESGVVEFRVNVQVLNADEKIRPGFTAVVSVVTNQVENALLVPNQAVVNFNGGSAVMIANADGSTTPVPVETGASSETFTEILSGDISEEDQLAVTITEGQNFMPGFGVGAMRQFTGGGGQRPQD